VKLLYRLFLVVRALLLAIGVAMLLGVLVAAGWGIWAAAHDPCWPPSPNGNDCELEQQQQRIERESRPGVSAPPLPLRTVLDGQVEPR
jgi:hypothetical protein